MKAPKQAVESEEQKARREQAEKQAEKNLIGEVRDGVSRETAALLRRFGVRAAQAGSPGGGFGGGGRGGMGGGGADIPSSPATGFIAQFGGGSGRNTTRQEY